MRILYVLLVLDLSASVAPRIEVPRATERQYYIITSKRILAHVASELDDPGRRRRPPRGGKANMSQDLATRPAPEASLPGE